MQELHGLFTKDLLSPTLYRDYSTKAAYKEKLGGFSSAPCFPPPLSAALCKHRLHDEDFADDKRTPASKRYSLIKLGIGNGTSFDFVVSCLCELY